MEAIYWVFKVIEVIFYLAVIIYIVSEWVKRR